MVYLSRFIDCPYFLTNNNITVFSEIKSFELHLFSDDIRKYGIIKSLNETNMYDNLLLSFDYNN